MEIFQPTMQPPILAAGTYMCDSKAFRNFHRLCLGGHILWLEVFFYLETANEKGFRDNYCKKILIMQ